MALPVFRRYAIQDYPQAPDWLVEPEHDHNEENW